MFTYRKNMLALRARTEAGWVQARASVLSRSLFFRYLNRKSDRTDAWARVHPLSALARSANEYKESSERAAFGFMFPRWDPSILFGRFFPHVCSTDHLVDRFRQCADLFSRTGIFGTDGNTAFRVEYYFPLFGKRDALQIPGTIYLDDFPIIFLLIGECHRCRSASGIDESVHGDREGEFRAVSRSRQSNHKAMELQPSQAPSSETTRATASVSILRSGGSMTNAGIRYTRRPNGRTHTPSATKRG